MSRVGLRMLFAIVCVLVLAATLSLLLPRPVPPMDLAAVNAVLRAIEANGPGASTDSPVEYAVLDEEGSVLFMSATEAGTDLLASARDRDLVLPVRSPAGEMLLVVFDGGLADAVSPSTLECVTVLLCATGEILAFAWALGRLDRRILTPYRQLEGAARHIARGQFDFPLEYEKGTAFGALTESIDLLRTELARAQEAERQTAESKKKLISDLSHELRTPLAAMMAAAELGELKAPTPEVAETCRRIAEKGRQLGHLSANLLSASLADERELAVRVRAVSADTVRELLQDASIEGVPPVPGSGVMADPLRLAQIFDNIVSNTLKHGRTPLAVQARVRDGMLLLEFEDNGGGVDEEELPTLRLRGARGRRAKGTEGAGIGLYICDQLVQAMDGQLLLRNGPRGLQVIIALPLAQP